MTNILLICSGGASTSMLAEKMCGAAEAKGVEVKVWAVGEQAAADNVPEADVVPGLQAKYPDKPIDSIDMRAYGMMDGVAVLDKAFALIG